MLYDNVRQIERIAPSPPLRITVTYPQVSQDYELADIAFQSDAGRWFALGAPQRLKHVGETLTGFFEKVPAEEHLRAGYAAVEANVVRTAMFGAHRVARRWKEGQMETVSADEATATSLARRLNELGLDFFDPSTREQTAKYLRELLGAAPESKPRRRTSGRGKRRR